MGEEVNKRLENKITRWYGQPEDTPESRIAVRVWLAKHWYRWITYGCTQCYIENCGCGPNRGNINEPKGFAEIAEYAYNNYGEAFRE